MPPVSGRPILSLDSPEVTERDLVFAAEQVAQRLRSLSVSSGPSALAQQFYTRIRAKTPESIREKVSRKRRSALAQSRKIEIGIESGLETFSSEIVEKNLKDLHYSYRDITDAVGFRIVTLYDEQLKTAIDYALTLIDSGQRLSSDPLFQNESILSLRKPDVEGNTDCIVSTFRWELFHEGLFIRRDNVDGDPYAQANRYLENKIAVDCKGWNDVYKDFGPFDPSDFTNSRRIRTETRNQTRYSSAHLIFFALGYVGNFIIKIPVEFQIRTAVEDIWAEIDHKLSYKSVSDSSWSHRHQIYHDQASAISLSLKKLIDNLPEVIDDFYAASSHAGQYVSRKTLFPNDRRSESFEFSLVISLFFSIGNDEGARFTKNVGKYQKRVKEMRDAITLLASASGDLEAREAILSKGREAIQRALYILDDMARELDESLVTLSLEIGDSKRSTLEAADFKLAKERRALCDLEVLRLRTILLTNFDGTLLDRRIPSLKPIKGDDRSGRRAEKDSPSKDNFDFDDRDARGNEPHYYSVERIDEENRKLILHELYGEFCEYLERDVSLRPKCMIYYFKYKIMSRINDFLGGNLAGNNLKSSMNALIEDDTIPRWSIYRVLLPRTLSKFELMSTESLLAGFKGDKSVALNRMSTVKTDIHEKISRAIDYCLEAQRAFRDDSDKNRSGDLLEYIDENKAIDIIALLDLLDTYSTLFGGIFYGLLNDVKARINLYLTQFTKDFVDGGEDGEMAAHLARASHYMMKLSGELKGEFNG